MRQYMKLIGSRAKKASLIKINETIRNKVLKKYVSLVDKEKNSILIANRKDVKFAKKKN